MLAVPGLRQSWLIRKILSETLIDLLLRLSDIVLQKRIRKLDRAGRFLQGRGLSGVVLVNLAMGYVQSLLD